ncbi:valine--tRNA ligase [Candidatus Microgenomates bacterium]|nr:valine--tRNA ligase [Candidatus Microgenomates bacterium]
MDKVYKHQEMEGKIYQTWEESGYFQPQLKKNASLYSIILPPPNANAPLHFGHAMYVIEDILIRYHRMKGSPTLWLPGADHAGFETQFVFEKYLASQGKSRFDYDRKTLYQMIWDFVEKNRGGMESQLRRLGFSLDWNRMKFTLDEDIIGIVYKTFKKMYDDGLVYRAKRLVNYCTKDGTSFSDLEVIYEERKDPLYYIKYGPLVLATVRPETKFGDTGVAVHPQDKRYQKYVGKEIEIETVLGPAKIKVVADETVDPEFGTGVIKVTPAHDFTDFEIGQRHNLPARQVIDFNGKLNDKAGKFAGLTVKQARTAVVEIMKKRGLLEKVDENYQHRVGLCYKCKTVIEPLPLEQWFVKMEPLAKPAIDAVKKGEIKIFPRRFEKIYFQFLENIKDWNISRQIVWGIRIPAWRNTKTGRWMVTEGEAPSGKDWEQDSDVFDTWFSSAQWPFATLMSSPKSKINNQELSDYEYFYPTSVMETGYEILRWWVARMVMVGLYTTKKIPFEHVVLHGMVRDPLGQKMSKSKGNVVNPLELIDQYGADAVRFALVYGTALGNDQALSYPKLQAARNFTNKLWNITRFIDMKRETLNPKSEIRNNLTIKQLNNLAQHKNDKEIVGKTQILIKTVTKDLEAYNFNRAAETLYDFIWHTFADKYIEDVKNRLNQNSFLILHFSFLILLRLLHPFMPFITEKLYQLLSHEQKSIMIEAWPR